jgi:predicted porin
MNKKIIAAAIAASFVAAPVMADNVTVYGKIKQGLDYVDVNNTAATDMWMLNDHTSRLGFKGSEDLGNGLKAIFQVETSLDPSTASGVAENRNTFVGLSGDFGTVLVGRHDAPHNLAWASTDIFADTVADSNRSGGVGGDGTGLGGGLQWNRVNGTIAYISPTFSGFHGAIALVPGENGAGVTAKATDDGIADSVSVALVYSNAGIHAAVGHHAGSLANTDITNVSLGYTWDAFTANVVWEDQDAALQAGGLSQESWILSGAYTMGNNKLKLRYYNVENEDGTANDRDGWALGLDHNFSKRTQAQLTYVTGGASNDDGDMFSIQMNHSF